jgi:hypothetical protein
MENERKGARGLCPLRVIHFQFSIIHSRGARGIENQKRREVIMATPIQQVEKEYFLGALNYKRVPLKCFVARTEYTFTLRELGKDRMVFEAKTRLTAFQKNTKIEFKFSLWSVQANIIAFSVFVFNVDNNYLITSIPDYLYKDLSRLYSRVQQAPCLNMIIREEGFYYDLNYEKINMVDSAEFDDFVFQLDEDKINTFIHEHLHRILQQTNGYKLSLFAHTGSASSPLSIEEKAVGTLGKILFISMPDGGIVAEKETAEELFFTDWSFFDFLLKSGETPESAREKIARLLRQTTEQNICSDCYVPIVFLSYIIGYIRIWVKEGSNPPITFPAIKTFRQLAKIIAFSLEQAHYFEDGKKEIPPFSPKLLDISAGGFLFALNPGNGTTTYSVNDRFSVQITIADRVIRCKASIVRVQPDTIYVYYGCKFDGMDIKDTQFLFEALYEKSFADNDMLISGAV